MIFRPLKVWLIISPVLFLLSVGFTRECKDCHLPAIRKYLKERYLHPPFAEGKCGKCHLYGYTAGGERVEAETIRLFSPGGRQHLVAIPYKEGTRWRGCIRIRAAGRVREREVEIDAERLPVVEDRTPPRITPPRIGEIKRGVFWQAEILWETDEPATSQVEFSPDGKYWMVSPREKGFGCRHRIIITELEEGMRYHLRVRSADAWGNEAVSQVVAFRVAEKEGAKERRRGGEAEIRKVSAFRTPGGLVLLCWETTEEAEGVVELKELKGGGEGEEMEGHEGLIFKGDRERGFESCYRCHPPHTLGVSHPVGIRIPPEMKVSKGIPTANGLILCTSCHAPHGSRYPYLLRLSGERELCVSCHGERY